MDREDYTPEQKFLMMGGPGFGTEIAVSMARFVIVSAIILVAVSVGVGVIIGHYL